MEGARRARDAVEPPKPRWGLSPDFGGRLPANGAQNWQVHSGTQALSRTGAAGWRGERRKRRRIERRRGNKNKKLPRALTISNSRQEGNFYSVVFLNWLV